MTKQYEFHYDAGHGWLKVPLSEITPEIRKMISQYSYMDKEFAYLEEDADAWTFLRMTNQAENPNFNEISDGDFSKIRYKRRFQ